MQTVCTPSDPPLLSSLIFIFFPTPFDNSLSIINLSLLSLVAVRTVSLLERRPIHPPVVSYVTPVFIQQLYVRKNEKKLCICNRNKLDPSLSLSVTPRVSFSLTSCHFCFVSDDHLLTRAKQSCVNYAQTRSGIAAATRLSIKQLKWLSRGEKR